MKKPACMEERPCKDTGRKRPSLSQGVRPQETRPGSTLIWTSSLQNCEKINFCCLSHLVCGISLWQPQPTKTPSRIRSLQLTAPPLPLPWHVLLLNPLSGDQSVISSLSLYQRAHYLWIVTFHVSLPFLNNSRIGNLY